MTYRPFPVAARRCPIYNATISLASGLEAQRYGSPCFGGVQLKDYHK